MRAWIRRSRDRPGVVLLLVALVLLGAVAAGGPSFGQQQDPVDGRPGFPSSGVWLEQVVTRPFLDWHGDGRVTSVDEFVLLRNHARESVDLSGWVLEMIDGTDEQVVLDGVLGPHEPLTVLNPPGQINNDVTLRLLDDVGGVVDEVTLGENGIPDGRGGSVLDEAVHLTGHWMGERAPGTAGDLLGPVWVSHLAAAGTLDHADPLGPAWVAPEGGRLELRVVALPDHEPESLELRTGGALVPLEAVEEETGVWRMVEPLGPSDENRSVELAGEGLSLRSFPAGGPLRTQVDPVVPSFTGIHWPPGQEEEMFFSAVADDRSRIRWFPPLETGPGGLVDVQVLDAQGAVQEDCVPLEDPDEGCVVEGGEVDVRLQDAAGRRVQETLPVVSWDTPTEIPEIQFDPAARPTLFWGHPARPVESVVVQVAEDPEVVGSVDEHVVSSTAGRFVDGSWVPGEPRAYRLRLTDLAKQPSTGPWVVLEPQDVPVQVEWDDADLHRLGSAHEADLTLRFDRPMQQPPFLSMRLERPVPLHLEVEGEPIVSEHAYVYRVQLPTQIEEAVGSWGLVGGRGEDGAPVAASARNLTWDSGAPRVHLDGVPRPWIRSSRHVVTVQAVDGVDPAPVVSFPGLPAGATVASEGATTQVVLHKEGAYEIEGVARDASGNERRISLRVGLDATPPVVKQLERPASWSVDEPVLIQVDDGLSGVNGTSLQAWAKDGTGGIELSLEDGGNGTVALLPANRSEPVQAPFEVYVAVADQAGNGVEGFLSKPMVHVPLVGNVTDIPRETVPEARASTVQAPSFLGPPWKESGDQAGASHGGRHSANVSSQGASRWDGFSWDEVPPEEETRSWAWYVVAFVGAVTLGTAVHRVRAHRVRAKGKRSRSGASSDQAHGKKEAKGEQTHPGLTDPGPEGPAAVREDDAGPSGWSGWHGHRDEEGPADGSAGIAAPSRRSRAASWSEAESGKREESVRFQSRLDLWCDEHGRMPEGPLKGVRGKGLAHSSSDGLCSVDEEGGAVAAG